VLNFVLDKFIFLKVLDLNRSYYWYIIPIKSYKIKNFKKLIVWQRSMELASETCKIVEKLPKRE
jgi:hypothetical protein